MELSKKAAYLKGLMAGLKISGDTPEGQVLLYMGELLEQMADEIEENSHALNAVTDYIDELEDGGDPLDEIDTYEYGFDPEKGEDGSDEVDEETPETAPEKEKPADIGKKAVPDKTAGAAHDKDEKNSKDKDLFSFLLDNITSDPNYTDGEIDANSSLVESLKNMMSSRSAEKPEPLADNSDDDGYEEYYGEDDDITDADEDDDPGEMIFGMKCPFCHSDITFTEKDIKNSEFECPVCGNRLTIMM